MKQAKLKQCYLCGGVIDDFDPRKRYKIRLDRKKHILRYAHLQCPVIKRGWNWID